MQEIDGRVNFFLRYIVREGQIIEFFISYDIS